MRRLGCVVVAAILGACSDDGTPANESEGDFTGSADDGDTASSQSDTGGTGSGTVTITDTGPMSSSGEDGPGSTGADGSTGGGTEGTGTSSDTGTGGDACVTDDDCIVVDDCCNCTAIATDAEPPMCDIPNCLQSTCSALGITPVAQCELGSCELGPMSCDPSVVSCESLPPDCGAGTFPGTDENTMCWTGLCVPAELCDVVPSCADCPEAETCVEYVMQGGPEFHCSPIPEACDGTPSCECLSDVCIGDFDTCGEGPDGLTCSCPVCG